MTDFQKVHMASLERYNINCPYPCLINMQTHVFREYLRKNDQFSKTVFACSYGAQIEFWKKKSVKNLVTLSLKVYFLKKIMAYLFSLFDKRRKLF